MIKIFEKNLIIVKNKRRNERIKEMEHYNHRELTKVRIFLDLKNFKYDRTIRSTNELKRRYIDNIYI